MHELGIVFHIMDSLEKIGKENQLSEIANVTLEIGEVSGVVDAYLKDCWKWAVRKSDLLKKAELITETIEAVTFCEDCGSTYSLSLIHICCFSKIDQWKGGACRDIKPFLPCKRFYRQKQFIGFRLCYFRDPSIK